MSILDIVSRNFRRGSRTRRPTEMVEFPTGFRGALAHDPALCTGCKTCAYVCSPSAITFDESHLDSIAWQYSTGQCTFCGRCVEFCPCGALSFNQSIPPLAADRKQQRVSHSVTYQHCQRCDKPIMPIAEQVLAHLYGHAPSADTIAEQKLCDECRRELTSRRMKQAFGANK